MLLGTRTNVLALVVAILAVSFAAAGTGARPAAVAAPAAGSVAVSSLAPLFIDPANGTTINSATPTITVALAPVPATVVAADLHLDGMNLTSAGTLQDNTFVLPLALSLRNGPHVANFTAFDNLGGLTFVNWTFTVDTIPPILLVTAPAYPLVPTSLVLVEGTAFLVNYTLFPGAAPINVTATVLPSGARRWAYPVAGPFSIPVPLTEGVNTIFVNATDKVGNVAVQIVNVVSDTVKPPLVVLSPANRSVSPSNLVRVSGLSEFGVFLSVNGYSVTVAPNGTWSVVLALPEGLNILPIAAADQVGNLNYTGWVVFVDSDVPEITLASPTATLSSKSQVLVAGTVSDTELVALLVNGLPVTFNATGAFSTTLTLLDGMDPIIIVAVDAAQHTTILRTAIRVDTTAPRVTLTSPPDGLETNGWTVRVRGTVNDPNATVLVNDQMIRPDAAGNWQTTVGLVLGANAVYISAVDAAGNRAATLVLHVEEFSPIPDLENRSAANAANLDELGAMVRFSLVGILLLALGVEFVLYARSAKQARETREIVAALVRRRKPKT